MTDELKAPVAIRITRPYATEEEFLEREFDTLTHTSVVLLGAQARPQGVVLRFEIVLKTGESLLRGEGRVVGYKERAYGGEPGLTLRFTRLDSRSKTLVDRASSLRDARVRASTSLMSMPAVVVPKPGMPPAPLPVPSPSVAAIPELESSPRLPTPLPSRPSSLPPSSRRGPPPLPEWARSVTPPPFPAVSPMTDIESTQVDAHFLDSLDIPGPAIPASAPEAPKAAVRPSSPPPLPASRGIRPTPARPPPMPRPVSVPPPKRESAPPPPLPSPSQGGPTAPRPATAMASVATRPADREALLLRLRTRAGSLPPARVTEILAQKRQR